MNKKNLLKLALYSFIIAAVILAFSFYFYHFVTSEGFTLTYHKEPGKPFISNMIANFGVMFLFFSCVCLLINAVCFKED